MLQTRTYGAEPKVLQQFDIVCKEMMCYQYLPIKLAGATELTREPRLAYFDTILGVASCDFIADYGLNRYVNGYVYLTAKHLWQGPNTPFNRPGYHCDGFMTNDVNYVWSNKSSTVFNFSRFQLTQDDEVSTNEMERQAEPRLEYSFPNNALLRLDQFCVHKVREPDHMMLRSFLKISFSPDRYDLVGNAHNYLLDYDWPMRERASVRNIPQHLSAA